MTRKNTEGNEPQEQVSAEQLSAALFSPEIKEYDSLTLDALQTIDVSESNGRGFNRNNARWDIVAAMMFLGDNGTPEIQKQVSAVGDSWSAVQFIAEFPHELAGVKEQAAKLLEAVAAGGKGSLSHQRRELSLELKAARNPKDLGTSLQDPKKAPYFRSKYGVIKNAVEASTK